MPSDIHIRRAARIAAHGGVIAYPTEGVFGLGCDPARADAVERILELKQRPMSAGLILIASDVAQLDDWIAPDADEVERLLGGAGTTWVVTASPAAPDWITGGRKTIAVRVTDHAIAAALCRHAAMPLVSTSANTRGRPPAVTAMAVRLRFGERVDAIVPGAVGSLDGPTEIRVARTGRVLRPG